MKQTVEVDIIDGYELSSTLDNITFDGKKATMIFWKQKQTKDFDYFVDQYLSESNSTVEFITGWIPDRDIEVARQRLKTKQFDLVCWEIKIGLFKFICEESYPYSWRELVQWQYDELSCDIKRLLPQEFIDDLFKTKTN